jgi:hypothetical protein
MPVVRRSASAKVRVLAVIRLIHTGDQTGDHVYPSAIGGNAGKRAVPNALIDDRH